MFTEKNKSAADSVQVGGIGLHVFSKLIEEAGGRESRGFVYQIAANCETAIADHEYAFQLALSTRDQRVVWQSLMHSATALASREHSKAGDYFEAALELAWVIAEPLILSHSLNRMGRWLTHLDCPREGIVFHQQAFDLLEQTNERHEIARTLDALGNSYACLGNLKEAVLHYRNAVGLFRGLDDPTGLSSALTGLSICGIHYLNSVSKWMDQDLVQCVEVGEEALILTQRIGWRSGEALAAIHLGLALSLPGNYGRALRDVEYGLQIAKETKHVHWQILAHIVIGAIYLDLLSYQQAQEHLEKALSLSAQVRSNRWYHLILGFLTPTYILQADLPRAESVLSSFSTNTPMETIAQRQAWLAMAELRLAQGDSSHALKIVDKLIRAASSIEEADPPLSRLIKLRCEILIHLGRDDEAREGLTLGLKSATDQGAQSLVWRFHVLLGRLYWQQRRYSKSERHYLTARRWVEKLANTIPDVQLRAIFLHQANTFIPQRCMRRAEKLLYGGLTRRQYEIAALIAQRKSNREIADQLRISEPGVEKHFRSILTKLGFNSPVQIRSWMVSRQVAEYPNTRRNSV